MTGAFMLSLLALAAFTGTGIALILGNANRPEGNGAPILWASVGFFMFMIGLSGIVLVCAVGLILITIGAFGG